MSGDPIILEVIPTTSKDTRSPNAFARIVDIGANYGGVAVALAQHQPFARLMVLEPNPQLGTKGTLMFM